MVASPYVPIVSAQRSSTWAEEVAVIGSVQTNEGTVTVGNTGGDTSVAVTVGSIPGSGASVTITFRATINNSLPANVTSVRNQGSVSGGNFPTFLTGDPNTPQLDDPTITDVTSTPAVDVSKTVAFVALPASLLWLPHRHHATPATLRATGALNERGFRPDTSIEMRR